MGISSSYQARNRLIDDQLVEETQSGASSFDARGGTAARSRVLKGERRIRKRLDGALVPQARASPSRLQRICESVKRNFC
jgi:hypothetical protein